MPRGSTNDWFKPTMAMQQFSDWSSCFVGQFLWIFCDGRFRTVRVMSELLRALAGADPGGGGGGRSPLPIEMVPLGIMPPSEVRYRPSGLECCPLAGEPKKGQRIFSSKVVPKKVNKNRPRPKKGQQKSSSTPVPAFRHPIWAMPPPWPWNNAALAQAAPCL